MAEKTTADLEMQLREAHKEIDYYRKIAEQSGDLRLRETEELSKLIVEYKKIAEENSKLVLELKEALANIKTLSGLLPICASCKKIKNDQGYWEPIEGYILRRSEAEFSHGICPECAKKLYPKFCD
jgi:hypothetical protein